MPNNMEGRGLTDREMLQLCLELEKGRVLSLSSTMVEASHKELRDIYRDCLDTACNNQYSLYEIMEQRGWYKTEKATTEQIGRVQALMQNNLHPDDHFSR
ncbi:spore coat protein [Anaerobacillus alkaliphilus]|uniref:Spore coat protein n=1 Tax=Anaerobacillus alkaliphilus TaxID=1548597 RepID=A0A4Q0VNI0_9BACI|nr:spore coat protein [Anaerobacillus alkaliphilus]RXI96556.1 spore coat protein [Anaerobacillus alkaliphilus]